MTLAKLLKVAALGPRLLANEDAELYVAGGTNLKELCKMGLKPAKERRGYICYDKNDLDEYIDIAKEKNWEIKK
ncbi:MAG: hypothetical protein K1X66_02270 [Verrucomicrobiae bacterium]|nr:hypothetical protein [Verrucomicrobiae bacterium]